jgi:hypothetical protein
MVARVAHLRGEDAASSLPPLVESVAPGQA